jgi:hypothetical protein
VVSTRPTFAELLTVLRVLGDQTNEMRWVGIYGTRGGDEESRPVWEDIIRIVLGLK